MKTSIAVTPTAGKFAPIPLVGDYHEIIPLVSDLGFNAIEVHVRTPEDASSKILDPLISKYNIAVSAFAPGRIYTDDGLSFIDSDPSRRDAAIERMNAFSRRASELQAGLFVGFVRGKVSKNPDQRNRELDLMIESCRRCCEYAEPLGVEILWEPINRYEMDDFNTVQQALEFIRKVGMSNLKLLLDIFHMNIEEPSILDSLKISAEYTSYIHMVDSNRRAPGFGHIDFFSIAKTLRGNGFDGVISAEILPLPDPLTAARQAINLYRDMIAVIDAKEKEF